MSIHPIDVQTLFMRLSLVGKEQAVQREAAHLAQTLQGSELAREAEKHSKTVNGTRELEEGLESVNEDEESLQQRARGERDDAQGSEGEEKEVFRDPDIGNTIDISR